MSEKTLSNIRIINKHDTEENWLKATGFTPKQGELIVYDIDENYNHERLKIGDGVQNVNDLPFVQDAEHTHDDATTTASGFMPAVDKKKLDTYVDDSGSNTKFIGKNNSAVLNGGTINISAEQNLNGVRIYNSNKTTSGSFFIRPNEQGNPISIGHEKTYLSLNQEYTNNDVLVRGIATPESDNDAVNKTYVDASVSAVSTLVGDSSVSQQISDAIAGIDYPVDSVNGKTGAVQLTASDVGALPDTTEIPQDKLFTATYNGTSYNVSVTSTGFTYTAGNILVISFINTLADDFLTLNVNSLGSKNVYNEFNSSTLSNIYKYKAPVKSGDVLILMYDQNDHFVVLSHTRKTIFLSELDSNIQNLLLPYATVSQAGYFARVSSDGSEWVAEDIEIPSIEGLATETYVDEAVAAIVDSSPETLNTLNELAAALGDDPNFATTIATQIGALETKVGDTSVSEQIESAQIVYVGPTQPTDPNIKVWINTSEEGTGIVPVLPRVAMITLAAASWSGSSAPYSQVVEINTVTSASKIDLQPTVAQIVDLQNADIALMAENVDGVVTIYSFGGKPSADMTMQVLLTEVSYV